MSLSARENRRTRARLEALPEPDLTDPDNPNGGRRISSGPRVPNPCPEILAAFPRTLARMRGPGEKPRKLQQTLRLDPDVLAYFKAEGRLWQRHINAVLREAMEQ